MAADASPFFGRVAAVVDMDGAVWLFGQSTSPVGDKMACVAEQAVGLPAATIMRKNPSA